MPTFENIPGNILVPGMYVEFQSAGTPYQGNSRLLLIGQRLSTGSAPANAAILVRDGSENGLFGTGSMLAAMAKLAVKNAPAQEIWALPIDDDAAGTRAAGSLLVAGLPLTQPGAMAVYVAGRRVRIPVLTSDTTANVATKLAAEINANVDLPVTAAVNGGTPAQVDITARHKGAQGNDIAIDFGNLVEDGTLARDHITITAMSGGATDPDLTAPLAALGDMPFDWLCGPYGSAGALADVSDMLNDTSGRWAWSKMIYGHYCGINTGTVGSLATLGLSRNDQHASLMAARRFVSTPWEVAAAVGARVALHLSTAPELSRPLQTVPLIGIQGPRAAGDRLSFTDRQTLYADGISGYTVDADGTVRIDRLVTMYRTNASGDQDRTYLDVQTMAQSMYGIRYIKSGLNAMHGRKGYAATNPAGLDHIVTDEDLHRDTVHLYAELVADGVFQDVDRFAATLQVAGDASDHNRANFAMPLYHVNGLVVMAVAAVNHV